MFYGRAIKQGTVSEVTEEDGGEILHISQACLAYGNSSLDSSYLMVKTDDSETPFTVCALHPKTHPHAQLDLFFSVSKGVQFTMKGAGEIHLVGYFEPQEEECGMDGEEGSDEEGDAAEEEEQANQQVDAVMEGKGGQKQTPAKLMAKVLAAKKADKGGMREDAVETQSGDASEDSSDDDDEEEEEGDSELDRRVEEVDSKNKARGKPNMAPKQTFEKMDEDDDDDDDEDDEDFSDEGSSKGGGEQGEVMDASDEDDDEEEEEEDAEDEDSEIDDPTTLAIMTKIQEAEKKSSAKAKSTVVQTKKGQQQQQQQQKKKQAAAPPPAPAGKGKLTAAAAPANNKRKAAPPAAAGKGQQEGNKKVKAVTAPASAAEAEKFTADLAAYLSKKGRTMLATVGADVKKPAGIEKLGQFMRERPDKFMVENGFVSIKK